MSTPTTVPSPLVMAQFRRPPVVPVQVAVVVEPTAKAKIVRPGKTVLVTTIDDGVRKAKQIKPGMRVRPWLKGEARGSERLVTSVERIGDNNEVVRVEFAEHPTQDYKPAYRFVDLDAIGQEITVRQPTFVEVAR